MLLLNIFFRDYYYKRANTNDDNRNICKQTDNNKSNQNIHRLLTDKQ